MYQLRRVELSCRLDYQPLFGKGARAPPPNSGQTRHERAAEIEPNLVAKNYNGKNNYHASWNSCLSDQPKFQISTPCKAVQNLIQVNKIKQISIIHTDERFICNKKNLFRCN